MNSGTRNRWIEIRGAIKSALPQPYVVRARRLRDRIGFLNKSEHQLTSREVSDAVEAFCEVDWHPESHRRIIYALTPSPGLANIGDHAQVVAIRKWFSRHYSDLPVVELDKNMVIAAIDQIADHVRPTDLIFLHSGGNLGDRARWSETARRVMIQKFPSNQIVSLPQTIYFSDSKSGNYQRMVTEAIYSRHPHLTVIGRDKVSGEIANSMFPNAQTFSMPDFVLSLHQDDFKIRDLPVNHGKVLACLRLDSESAFSMARRAEIVENLGRPVTLFDTTLDRPIAESSREEVVRETLELFASHDVVVTDRYHGLIFGVICQKPVVVLPTVDHKLTSALEWFANLPNVRQWEGLAALPRIVAEVENVAVTNPVDFNGLYFDRLPSLIAENLRREGVPSIPMPPEPGPQTRRRLRRAAVRAKRFVRSLPFFGGTKLKAYDVTDLDTFSDDELLAFMRHDAHRIEKSFYNQIFEEKLEYYEGKRDNIQRIASILKGRGFNLEEPTYSWAVHIANLFRQVESEFIRPNSTPASEPDLSSGSDFVAFAASRRSSRVWARRQPAREDLIAIARMLVDGARWAPNSGDRQPWRFLIMEDAASKRLLKGLKEAHCYEAPCVVFVGADRRIYGALGAEEGALQVDAGAALMQMVLTAHAAKLGVCWNHFTPDLINSRTRNKEIYRKFAAKMSIPDYIEPVAIIAFGVAAFHPPVPPRMEVDALLLTGSE